MMIKKNLLPNLISLAKTLIFNKEAILFMDGVHPHPSTIKQYGWILKGQETKFIPSNTGRARVNIIATIDANNKQIGYKESVTISSMAVIELFDLVQLTLPHK